MNRAERRRAGERSDKRASGYSAEGPHNPSDPSTVNAHGVCRGCSKRTHLWLPARICTKCIKRSMAVAQRESDAALLAALEAMDEEDE